MIQIKVLKRARAIVAKGWCQKEGWGEDGEMCASAAITDSFAALNESKLVPENDERALNIFKRSLPTSIVEWNDAPMRTQKQVIAQFDLVINALESARETA